MFKTPCSHCRKHWFDPCPELRSSLAETVGTVGSKKKKRTHSVVVPITRHYKYWAVILFKEGEQRAVV